MKYFSVFISIFWSPNIHHFRLFLSIIEYSSSTWYNDSVTRIQYNNSNSIEQKNECFSIFISIQHNLLSSKWSKHRISRNDSSTQASNPKPAHLALIMAITCHSHYERPCRRPNFERLSASLSRIIQLLRV